jgi:hypothetical protein
MLFESVFLIIPTSCRDHSLSEMHTAVRTARAPGAGLPPLLLPRGDSDHGDAQRPTWSLSLGSGAAEVDVALRPVFA